MGKPMSETVDSVTTPEALTKPKLPLLHYYYDFLDWFNHQTDRLIDEDPRLKPLKIISIILLFTGTLILIPFLMNLHKNEPLETRYFVYFLFIPAIIACFPFGRSVGLLLSLLATFLLLLYSLPYLTANNFLNIAVAFIPAIILIPIIYQIGFSIDKYRQHLHANHWRLDTLRDLTKETLDWEERKRKDMSQKIHDNTLQTLAHILIKIENVTENGFNDTAQVLRNAIEDVRKFLSNLNFSPIEELGLEAAVLQAVEHLEQNSDCKVHLNVDIPQIEEEFQQQLVYQIINEGTSNILKHANASHAYIYLESKGDTIEIKIIDNGIGFDVKDTAPDHYGLRLLEDRLKMCVCGKCSIKIFSKPGKGTVLHAKIPLEVKG